MSIVRVCCQVEVSAMGQSLVQRSPTECGASVIQNLQKKVGLGQLQLSSHENKTTKTTQA